MGQAELNGTGEPRAPLGADTPPARLLLVDPGASDRSLAALLLHRVLQQCEVLEAGTATEFADHLANGAIDLVITENRLGWSDGFKVLETVRRLLADCPVVLFTGGDGVAGRPTPPGFAALVAKSDKGFSQLTEVVACVLRERAARNTQHRREAFVDQLPQGVLALGADGTVQWANAHAYRMLPQGATGLRGHRLWELPGLKGWRDVVAPLLNADDAGERPPILLGGRRPDGSVLQLRLQLGAPLPGTDGTPQFPALVEELSEEQRRSAEQAQELTALRHRVQALEGLLGTALEETRALERASHAFPERAGRLAEALEAVLTGHPSPGAPPPRPAMRRPPVPLLVGLGAAAALVGMVLMLRPSPAPQPAPEPITQAAPPAPEVSPPVATAPEAAVPPLLSPPDLAAAEPVPDDITVDPLTLAPATSVPAPARATPPPAEPVAEEPPAPPPLAESPAPPAVAPEQPVAEEPEPATAPAEPLREGWVDHLMAQAAEREQHRQFTQPAGASARDAYLEVLQLEPDHAGALAGLRGIRDRYALWARNAESRGEWENALRHFRNAQEVGPPLPEIAANIARLEARMGDGR